MPASYRIHSALLDWFVHRLLTAGTASSSPLKSPVRPPSQPDASAEAERRGKRVAALLHTGDRLGLREEVSHDAVQLMDRMGSEAITSPASLAAVLLLASRQGVPWSLPCPCLHRALSGCVQASVALEWQLGSYPCSSFKLGWEPCSHAMTRYRGTDAITHAGMEAQAPSTEQVASEFGTTDEAVAGELSQAANALQGNLSAISAARILRLLVESLAGDFQARPACSPARSLHGRCLYLHARLVTSNVACLPVLCSASMSARAGDDSAGSSWPCSPPCHSMCGSA